MESAMTQITIPAQVVNGHLQHEKSLPELEGEHVLATLTLVAEGSKNGTAVPGPPNLAENAEFDPEPPLWLEVENDVYFPITVPAKSLGKVKVRKRRGKPSIILPGDLPDE
jgi:hypothetical protein